MNGYMDDPHYAPSVEFLRNKANQFPHHAGRIPPQNREMEECVIGAMLVDPKGASKVEDLLITEAFYVEANKVIFQGMMEMHHARQPIDMMTIIVHLRETGKLEEAGGHMRIVELSTKVASGAHMEYHAGKIMEAYYKRELIKIGDKAVKDGYDETVPFEEAVDAMQTETMKLEMGAASGLVPMSETAREGIDRVEAKMKAKLNGLNAKVSGIPSGLDLLDNCTSGFKSAKLVIIAARPAMGKTTLAINIAINASAWGANVHFYSLEMEREEIEEKIACTLSELNPRDVDSGEISVQQLGRLGDAWYSQGSIIIDDKPAISVRYVSKASKGMMRRAKGKPHLIIIDYLQLMSGRREKGGNREQEVASISRDLKELAKDLKTPIIALSQLSRSVETRGGDKKPMLSDLRESGGIEQDADIVMFCYRPSYYGLDTYEDGKSTHGIGELLVAKHRGGPVGEFKFGWDPRIRGWHNLGEFKDSDPNQLLLDNKMFKPKDFSMPSHQQEGWEGEGRGQSSEDFMPY